MKYFLGIDGGGTKTAYLLADETGKVLAQERTAGCSYKDIGLENTAKLLKEGAARCAQKAGMKEEQLAAIALGLPCLGEYKKEDAHVIQAIKKVFSSAPIHITNDVEAGWAGSLGLQPGINIVAGTGSIAFGKNIKGESRRSGGWSAFFGDEGSCHWLGRRTMELFSKEADGRVPKSSLYEILMEEFALEDEMDFIGYMDREYIGDRSKVASLQKFLLQAARDGDISAQELYRAAAEELGIMAGSILKQLWDEEEVPVSYSGGLFHAREFVLPVLEELVKKQNGYLVSPKFSPAEGAVLMAMSTVPGIEIAQVTENWNKEMRKYGNEEIVCH